MPENMTLTDAAVEKLQLAPQGERYIVRDTKLPGFLVRVGTHRKTYMIKIDTSVGGKRRTVSETIGHAGHITATKARDKAQRRILDLRDETLRPVELGPTLREGWERVKIHLERDHASQDTFDSYRNAIELHLADWLDLPIAKISHAMVVDRHDQLSVKRTVNGQKRGGAYIANRVLKTFRTVYRHARKSCPQILTIDMDPTLAIDWHKEERRNRGMAPEDLAAWYSQLQEIRNPLRRELHLLLLLSGSRPTALCSMENANVHIEQRALYVPRPKGGEDRAFWMPLSTPMLECIERARQAGAAYYPKLAKKWLFPSADSRVGHITNHAEKKTDFKKGNDLRQTYRNVCRKLKIPKITSMQLMNHKVPVEGEEEELKASTGDVHDDYGTVSVHVLGDDLRAAQEKISAFIMDALLK